jgi:tRNA A-37 threonylcarbamoyl transferase component Bud32
MTATTATSLPLLEESPVVVSTGGFRWQLAPAHRDLLLGPHGLRLNDWVCSGAAQLVKHGPHRTVYRVTLPELSFYLKHNRVHNVRALLRQLVRPSKSRIEYDRARAFARRGVPTFVPLALGEQETGRKPGDSYLLTASLDGAESLSTFIESSFAALAPSRRARVRQELAVTLARLLARMHDAGVIHNDLHAGNLLIQLAPDDQVRLFVVDLHAVRLGSTLRWQERRDNLVMLNRWFMMRVDRADRLRFWREYGRLTEISDYRLQIADLSAQSTICYLQSEIKRTARDLEKRTVESNLRFWRSRDRRCWHNNRYYRRVRSAVAAGHAVTDLDGAALAALLADPDEPFRRPGISLLKDSRSSTVAELELPVGDCLRRVIYKRFRVTTWSDPWVALVRKTPAQRSWEYGHGLRERGLPTARPLAVFHRRSFGLPFEGYLITEKIPQAVDLHAFIARLGHIPVHERRLLLRVAIDQAAHLVRTLHERGLSHRDLKAANILVGGTRDWGSGIRGQRTGNDLKPSVLIPNPQSLIPSFHLIDLVGVTNPRRLSERRRVQNLARLHASFVQDPALTRTDKLRFLRVYLQWGLRGRGGWKCWWREIEKATRAKIARNRRTGRPLA